MRPNPYNAMFEDTPGIMQISYQKRAQKCVTLFLEKFHASSRSQQLNALSENDVPFTIRVNTNPPSLQIRQLPNGGIHAGELRIHEKLARANTSESIVVAENTDLTRECIIVMLRDSVIDAILENGLLTPEQIASFLEAIRSGNPDFFIVVQRYIMGIERKDGLSVPYKIVPAHDDETFEYLSKLPGELL